MNANRLERECEYGIILGIEGRLAEAESVFVSLLSHAPGDARALNNLGNLSLIRGESAAAVSFFEHALAADSSDAGVAMNRATALLLAGEQEAAQDAALQALARAGGPDSLARLLGIPPREIGKDPSKEERRKTLSRQEVLMLLRVAAGKVPPDSVAAPPPARAPRPATWRAAGARNDDTGAGPALVYWKR